MKVTINSDLIEYIKKYNLKCIYRRHLDGNWYTLSKNKLIIEEE